MKRVGLFFGSFNPIHTGHLIVAQAVLNAAELKEIWFVVSPQNPFKKVEGLLAEDDRLSLVERAIADNYLFKASDVEFKLPKPSYTVDTLQILKLRHPDTEFYLIIGEDNLPNFHKWKDYELLLSMVEKLLVFPRYHDEASRHKISAEKLQRVEAPRVEISATYIRDLIKSRKPITYLVPESVELLIRNKGFYL